jgi:tetratricopeptide (TPR) repeat protein
MLRADLEGGPSRAPREPLVSMAVEVDRWIRRNRPDLLAASTSVSPSDAAGRFAEGMNRERAAKMLALLDDPDLDGSEWNRVWKEINDAGLTDDALALLKDGVENDPANPDAHMALAGGYLAKTTYTDNDLEKGTWAVAADNTLDRALELDPVHWDARFTKATCLTYYPPIMGRQGEAMKHFEILLEQQKSLPPDSKHSQTYLYLGNLHQQMGNHQKASQIWKDGLVHFPDSPELEKQLKNSMKN